MTGYLRFVFAMCVVYTHFGPHGQGAVGRMAVFGFYLLSGYLMTRVLNERYQFDFKSFAVNRALRLMPIFWIVSILAVMAVAIYPEAKTMNPVLQLPPTPLDWTRYLLLAIDNRFVYRPVPPSWPLGVELANYLILWLISARWRSGAWLLLALSVCYHAGSIALGQPDGLRYFPIEAAVLPFTLGALIHHEARWSEGYGRASQVRLTCGALTVWAAMVVVAARWHLIDLAVYVGLAALVVTVAMAKDLRLAGTFGRWDRWIGDLTYPLFLCHYPVGVLLFTPLLIGDNRSLFAFAIVSVPSLLVSVALAQFARHYIDPLRDRFRPEPPPVARPQPAE